jgi:uncharacterized protein YjbI with pentapeptide repeats
VAGTVLAIAVGFSIPVLATTAAPASADTVVDGCTIVSNPTPTNFTNCPGANLSGVDLSGVDLSYANFAGADFFDTGASTNLSGADLSHADLSSAVLIFANLSNANLSSANLTSATLLQCFDVFGNASCPVATLTGANLTGANLDDVALVTCAGFASHPAFPGCGALDLSGVDLSGAQLAGATLAGCQPPGVSPQTCDEANLTGATLTGANFTGTILVPSNQSVTATSGAAAVATWSTPGSIPGATPGSCTPASGSTFAPGSSTVTCQILDTNSDVATGTFVVTVAPFTYLLVPSNGAVLAGTAAVLDAWAADAPGINSVVFELTGGLDNDTQIATATATIYGWVAKWNTTTVPNGTYTLQSVATGAATNTEASNPITITVCNPLPTTSVLIPASGATLSGTRQVLDASASANVTSVVFELTGGPDNDTQIATATPTIYGWLALWDTTSVPDGTYTLQSTASYPNGLSATSAPVAITVAPPPSTTVIIPASGATIDTAQGYVLDALASPGATSVSIAVTANTFTETHTATPTIYGWIAVVPADPCPSQCLSAALPDSIVSVATYAGGVSVTSPPLTGTLIAYCSAAICL